MLHFTANVFCHYVDSREFHGIVSLCYPSQPTNHYQQLPRLVDIISPRWLNFYRAIRINCLVRSRQTFFYERDIFNIVFLGPENGLNRYKLTIRLIQSASQKISSLFLRRSIRWWTFAWNGTRGRELPLNTQNSSLELFAFNHENRIILMRINQDPLCLSPKLRGASPLSTPQVHWRLSGCNFSLSLFNSFGTKQYFPLHRSSPNRTAGKYWILWNATFPSRFQSKHRTDLRSM